MSYIRYCKTCGDRISIRQMPHGQWVAFEPNSDVAHDCYAPAKVVTTKKSDYKNNKNIKTVVDLENKTKITLNNEISETITDFNEMLILFNEAIEKKLVLKIEYTREDGEFNERNIEAIKVHNRSFGIYLEAFCQMRENNRIFKSDRIKSMSSTNEYFSEDHRSVGNAFIKDDEAEEQSSYIKEKKVNKKKTNKKRQMKDSTPINKDIKYKDDSSEVGSNIWVILFGVIGTAIIISFFSS